MKKDMTKEEFQASLEKLWQENKNSLTVWTSRVEFLTGYMCFLVAKSTGVTTGIDKAGLNFISDVLEIPVKQVKKIIKKMNQEFENEKI